METGNFIDKLSQQDRAKLLAAVPVVRGSIGEKLLHNFGATYTKQVSVEEFLQDFLQSLKFENGKGMLAKLDTYGNFDQLDNQWNRTGVNRELVEQIKNHKISLKMLKNSASFRQNNLSQNAGGKAMILAIIQQFIQQIDTQISGHIAKETRQRREEIKKRYRNEKNTDKKKNNYNTDIADFSGAVESLFREEYQRWPEKKRLNDIDQQLTTLNQQLKTLQESDSEEKTAIKKIKKLKKEIKTLEKEKSTIEQELNNRDDVEMDIDKSPLLKEIYPKISISPKDILAQMKQNGTITEKQENELFTNKRGKLEENLDCIITGDFNAAKLNEKIKERIQRSNGVQELATRPIPKLQDLTPYLPQTGNRTSPIDTNITNPTPEQFKTAFKTKFENADATNQEFKKLAKKFKKANKKSEKTFSTPIEIEQATDEEIKNYLIYDAGTTEVELPETDEEWNNVIKQGIHHKMEIAARKLPSNDPETKHQLQIMEKNLTNLLDLTKDEIIIPGPSGQEYATFKVKKTMGKKTLDTLRQFVSGKNKVDVNDALGMNFEITIDPEQQAYLDGPNGKDHILANKFFPITTKNGRRKLISPDYKVKIKSDNSASTETNLTPSTEQIGYLRTEIEGIPGETPQAVKDKQQQFGEDNLVYLINDEGKVVDAYTQNDLKNKDVDILENKVNLSGDDLQNFIAQVLFTQNGVDFIDDTINEDRQNKMKNTIDKNQPDETTEVTDNDKKDFYKFFQNDLKGSKFWNTSGEYDEKLTEKEMGIKKDTRLWVKTWRESERSPDGGNIRLQMKILDPNAQGGNSIEVELSGGESSLGGLEGKKIKLPKNVKVWKEFLNALDDAEIYKFPPIQDLPQCAEDFASYFPGNDGLAKITNRVTFETNGMQWSDGSKGCPEWFWAVENPGPEQKKVYLHVTKHNEKDKTFTVQYEEVAIDEEDKKKKRTVRKLYKEREMDYNNFLLFLTEKKLAPLEENEKKKQDETSPKANPAQLPGKSKKAYSISNFLHLGKSLFQGRETKLKEYGKQKDEDLMDIAVDKRKVYNIAGNVMGFFWWTGGAEGAARAHAEYRGNRIERSRAKIKRRQEILENDGDRGETMGQSNYLTQVFWGQMQDFILQNWKARTTTENDRFLLAALLLTWVKKGKWPYRGMPEMANQGHWIKLILGESHQKRFLEQRKLKKQQLALQGDNWRSHNKQLIKDMVRGEMDYLINVIDDRNLGIDDAFGNMSNDDYKNQGKSSTFYKTRIGKPFAKALDERLKETLFKDPETSRSEIQGNKNFTNCDNEYSRFIVSGRQGEALPFLKQMVLLAKTKHQWSKIKRALFMGLTSGLFRTLDPDQQNFIEKLSRTIGFIPGKSIIIPTDHPKKAASLLDAFSGGNFTKQVNRNWDFVDNEPMENKKRLAEKKEFYNGYRKSFEAFWKKYGQEVINNLDYLPILEAGDTYKKGATYEKKYEWAIQFYQNNADDLQTSETIKMLYGNGSVPTDNPFGQSKGSMQTLFGYTSTGEFNGQDEDTIQGQEDFWNGVKKNIYKYKQKPKGLNYLIKKVGNDWFANQGFDSEGKKKIVRTLSTIKYELNRATEETRPGIESQLYNALSCMIMWKIFERNSSVPRQLRDAVKAFVQAIREGIKSWKIDQPFINDCFPDEAKYFWEENRYYWMDMIMYKKIKDSAKTMYIEERAKISELDTALLNTEVDNLIRNVRGGSLNLKLVPEASNEHERQRKEQTNKELQECLSSQQSWTGSGTPPADDDSDSSEEGN